MRAPPSKLVYIGAKGAFRKFKGPSAKNSYLKIVQRVDALGRQGAESLKERKTSAPPNPPLPLKAIKNWRWSRFKNVFWGW